MTPAIAGLILEALIKYGPTAARTITEIFSKQVITVADWEKVFAACEKSYADYVRPV